MINGMFGTKRHAECPGNAPKKNSLYSSYCSATKRVGCSGVEIRHTEIRSGATAAGLENPANGGAAENGDDD